jgi:hypothetical protein
MEEDVPKPVFLLIHSPLVGPYSWTPVADALRRKGFSVVVPTLTSPPEARTPYWQQHAAAVVRALLESGVAPDVPLGLAGHSGAGPLLPAIGSAIHAALPNPLRAYLFVDAGWPQPNRSRLDQFDDPAEVQQFRQSAQAGLLPVWTDADLQPLIPDDALRRRFVSELRPLPLAVYEEALPVFSGWPDAPCGYLRFGDNPSYARAWAEAQQAGCRSMAMAGEHFHLLVEPEAVADALITLTQP